MSAVCTILFSILAYVFIVFISQLLASCTVKKLLKKITETAEYLASQKQYKNSNIGLDLVNLKTAQAKREKLGFITKTVGVAEFTVFSFLTILLIQNYQTDILEGIKIFSTFIGSWLAIKTLGNYQQWSGPILGRACFYTFIIGTFINIIFAILLGFILFGISLI